MVVDPNGNRKGVRYNVFGLPTSIYVMGKVAENKGDQMVLANEEDHPDDRPSVKMMYEWFRYLVDNNNANRVAAVAYENHYFDDAGNAQAQIKTQRSFTYSDGSGNVVLEKVNAEPGKVTKYENGQKITTTTNTRWVGSGRTIVNNKGNPVKQYEPFFDDDEEYTREVSLVCQGYSPIIFYDALTWAIKQENPNGTFTKVVFDAWSQTHYDENDTVMESEWYSENIALTITDAKHRSAKKTEIHANTPAKAYLDVLGRLFLTIDHNKGQRSGEGIFETFNETRVDYDIESNPIKVIDARGNVVMNWKYNMLGHQVYQNSMDGGERWMLPDAIQRELRKWDSRGHMTAHVYDALNRPLSNSVYDANGFITYEKYVYGETQPNPEVKNYRGQLFQLYDTGGMVQVNNYDFKGNVIHSERELHKDYKTIPNWPDIYPESLLNGRAFTTKTAYDAINRPVLNITPDNSEHRPEYNEGGLLEKVKVKIRGNGAVKTFVSNIDYNAKGQREKIAYGNNTKTSYVYDEKTYRLTKIETKRSNQFLQELNYTYDPVGNITEIYDNAQKTIFYGGQKIQQRNEYTYDALYQLLEATGREHTGQVSHGATDNFDDSWCRINHAPGDVMNLRNYNQKYNYDQVGNIMQMRHVAQNGNWTRNYQYSSNNNHLTRTSVGNGSNHVYNYSYNIHGSTEQLSHMTEPILWNFREEMQHIEVWGNVKAYYQYDGQGQRIRKVIEKGGLIEERMYLDGVEVYQERSSGSPVQLERETLHIQDGTGRISMVDTLIIENGVLILSPSPLTKYIYSNHLSTATLEADENGDIISYEEYHPFGTSSYTAVNASIQTIAKRYKFTSKERDDETGLYYHGARYYISWLGRWLSADPGGLIDGGNVYMYVKNNSLQKKDNTGLSSENLVPEVLSRESFASSFNGPSQMSILTNNMKFISIQSLQRQ
ncbi:MAG: RHS repeat-associated core domain-containing protein [Saprospiraceae bacterium]|nr:RHS repeat-associated core domain-containing protein [Saprospiraceae bacterium]